MVMMIYRGFDALIDLISIKRPVAARYLNQTKYEHSIDHRHHLLILAEKLWVLEPIVTVQYSRPYFFPSKCIAVRL